MEREQLEKLTREYQLLQEQLQAIMVQREQFKEQKEELRLALEEVEKSKAKIFLAIGGVMVDVDKETATKSIREKQESNSMRLSIVEKQSDEATKKEQTMRNQINEALKSLKQD